MRSIAMLFDSYDAWLPGAAGYLVPYLVDAMTARPASTFVNSPVNDGPRSVAPLTGERSANV